MTRRVHLLAAWLSLCAATIAQERLRVQGPTPATVVLGSAARVDLVVEGRGGEPETPRVPTVPGLSIQVAGPSRQSFTSITQNGMVEQITVQYQLVLQPQREGVFAIPAFAWRTGTREQTVPAMQLTVVKELRGAEFGYLDVRVEPKRVYVHEPIRVRVEFGVDRTLRPVYEVASNRARYFDFEIQAAWLSGMDGAETLPEPEAPNDAAPVVLNRTLQMAEYDSAHARAGKAYNTFAFTKAFLPTRPGTLTLDAPMLRYNVQLREGRRGLFGEVIGGQSQNYYVYGEPLQLEVLPIPERGRPTPYFGAVGRFELEAVLDRDTVKVGNSVKLALRIAGSGNFEFLRLPDVSALEQQGLHLLGQTEERKADAVTVTYDLTPLRADVTAVPPIDWNYFDTTPGVEKFVSLPTRALPLRVLPPDNPDALQPLPERTRKAVTPGVDDIFDLPSFDGPEQWQGVTPRLWVWLAVIVPWAMVVLWRMGRALRTRAAADPGKARGRRAAGSCQRALAAGIEPVVALSGYLADRLDVQAAAVIGPELYQRLRTAGLADDLATSVVTAVEQGIASRYGGVGGLDAAAVRALVARLEAVPLLRARAGIVGLLVLAAAVAPLRSQESRALHAWRNGDYAAAAAAFAAASEHSADRRLWFGRGNCYYRLGDLPRALWAFECARLGMPRDDELAANIALVHKQLQLDAGGEAFATTVAALRDRLAPGELTALCALCMTLAAIGLGLFAKRAAGRWLGGLAIVPGTLLALELLWWRPDRPPVAIALQTLALAAEPRAGLPAVATVQPGVAVHLRSGDSGEWVRVEVEGRSGYVPQKDIAPIR